MIQTFQKCNASIKHKKLTRPWEYCRTASLETSRYFSGNYVKICLLILKTTLITIHCCYSASYRVAWWACAESLDECHQRAHFEKTQSDTASRSSSRTVRQDRQHSSDFWSKILKLLHQSKRKRERKKTCLPGKKDDLRTKTHRKQKGWKI